MASQSPRAAPGCASPPAWVSDYVGVPWREHGRGREGCDCWGLAVLLYRERLSIELPAHDSGYAGAGLDDMADIAGLIAAGKRAWIEVPVAEARAFDLLLIRQCGAACHVGIVVAPGHMVHIEQGTDSVLDEYGGPVWCRRVVGAYRYPASAAMASAAKR